MSDAYLKLANSGLGGRLFQALGLPRPAILERWEPTRQSFVEGRVLVGAATASPPDDEVLKAVLGTLRGAPEAKPLAAADAAGGRAIEGLAAELSMQVERYAASQDDTTRFKALVFDATGIETTGGLRTLWAFFHPVIRKLAPCGRVVVIGRTPESLGGGARVAQRGLEGFTRSLGKELRHGATVQLVYVADGAHTQLESPLRFCLSPRSAFVSGQVLRVSDAAFDSAGFDWHRPLAGRKALVTGAARGIGAAIAAVLARDGAAVTVLDIPAMAADLDRVAGRIDGDTLALDITAQDAPARILEAARAKGGLDILVHNAGVTRDKTLGRMPEALWSTVLDINISSQLRINEALLDGGGMGSGGRIVAISSISGIAGNPGQTNYGCSKAAVIGMIEAFRDDYAAAGITINAVAPGFIETDMTAAMPFVVRQVGRRMNSLKQGGQPVDVAEAVSLFASPASAGLTGNLLRVCGQMLLGA